MKLIQVEFSRNTSFIYIEILKPLCKTFQSKGAGKKKPLSELAVLYYGLCGLTYAGLTLVIK